MNNVILPFLMSMMLGRTIDLTTYTISGSNVFDEENYTQSEVLSMQTTYNVLQEDTFPYTLFGIPADIVLRIKTNLLSSLSGAMGLDGVLKDTSWKYNSAVVSSTTVYRTVDRVLKEDAQPLDEWQEKIPASQTHLARSLFYGGWYVALFRFQCDIASDIKTVRRILTDHLGVVGVLTHDTQGSWDRALEAIKSNTDVRGNVTISSHVYSTTSLDQPISDPESLLSALGGLPKAVGAVGQPLYMELKPLNDLDSNFPVVKEHVEMLGELETLDQMFDDVKLTKTSLMKWMDETLTAFDEDQEEQIASTLGRLNECVRAFNKVARGVSLFGDSKRGDVEAAFAVYLGGLQKGIGTYHLAFQRMKEDIDAECMSEFHGKVRGLLRVYDAEVQEQGEVAGGLQECKSRCVGDARCRAVGFAAELRQLDLDSGLYLTKINQCWIYYRSTSTAVVNTPSGYSGDLGVYDRKCF